MNLFMIFLLQLLQLVVCHVSAVKPLPVHQQWCSLILILVCLDKRKFSEKSETIIGVDTYLRQKLDLIIDLDSYFNRVIDEALLAKTM